MNADRKSVTEQLVSWICGSSIHNRIRDECCPDFSCCGQTIWPIETRLRFAKAHLEGDYKTEEHMLMMSIGGMVANEFPTKKIHIAGDDSSVTQ